MRLLVLAPLIVVGCCPQSDPSSADVSVGEGGVLSTFDDGDIDCDALGRSSFTATGLSVELSVPPGTSPGTTLDLGTEASGSASTSSAWQNLSGTVTLDRLDNGVDLVVQLSFELGADGARTATGAIDCHERASCAGAGAGGGGDDDDDDDFD